MIKILMFGLCICALYALLVVITLIYSVIFEFNNNEALKFGFCLTSSCVDVVAIHFKKTIELYKSLLYMVVPLAGLFAGILGLNTYNLTVKNSIMNNHISNFKLFCEFIDRELKKKDLISSDLIDQYALYSKIYPKSRQGFFECFTDYNSNIESINNVIDASSRHYVASKSNTSVKNMQFNHTRHQYDIKECFEIIGINVSSNHRNTFNEVETQVLEFIDIVSKAFVEKPILTKVNERKYI